MSSLKVASTPLMLNLDIEIRLDLKLGVYKTSSMVIVLLTPFIFVWNLMLPFPTTLNVNPLSAVSPDNGWLKGYKR